MFYKVVGQAETDDLGMKVVVGHILDDSGTQSAPDGTVLYSYDATVLCADFLQDVLVDGLEETHIVMGNG